MIRMAAASFLLTLFAFGRSLKSRRSSRQLRTHKRKPARVSRLGDNKFEGKKLPMTIIADVLARFADLPVVDMTDLKGNYDFTMEFSPEDFRAMMIRTAIAQGTVLSPEVMKVVDASSGDTLFNAVEKLGLRLEHRKAPIDLL